jgi:hypothetical protein
MSARPYLPPAGGLRDVAREVEGAAVEDEVLADVVQLPVERPLRRVMHPPARARHQLLKRCLMLDACMLQ